MLTLSERQEHLEYECVLLGQKRYEDQREEQGESATLPGQQQVKRAIGPLTEAIQRFTEEAAKPGKAGRKHSALPYLLHVLPEQAAYITLRSALDGAAKYKSLAAIAIEIGTAIEDHINLVAMSAEAPGLYRKLLEQIKKATSERHRSGVLRHASRKYNLQKLKWGKDEKLILGTKLVELLEESTKLIRMQVQSEGKNHRKARLLFTEEAQAWFSDAHARASMWSPIHLPMLVRPLDWSTPFDGGYLTRAIRGSHMVLSYTKGYLDELKNVDMPEVYSAVNAVQSTPWKINTSILGVMKEALAAGERLQSLFVEADEPLPLRPAGLPVDVDADKLGPVDRERLTEWKARAAKTYEANARRASARASLAQKLWVAERFAPEAEFYFPHYLDFRGRIYPFASYLNPQGDDVARGLLQFTVGKPLGSSGAYWLKVHIANLFGVDKVSFEDRIKWVNEHSKMLIDCTTDPLAYTFWTTAESPWSALAAIFEYAGWLIQGDEFVSHLPIAMDGSCSGLQHYSAMLRDPIGGAAVNLLPSDKPGDIYTAVANEAQAFVDGSLEGSALIWKGGKVVRKIAKQPTMTLCYSATQRGMQGQIESAIRKLSEEKGEPYLGDADPYRASVYMAEVIWNALGETVVAARQAMDFLKGAARLAASKGLPIRWTAPSGFPVLQEYKQTSGKVIKVHYAGQRLELTVQHETDKLDKKKQAAGVAPNFVHSCDSAHLMATVTLGTQNGLNDWAVIHDSFGVHAADIDTLHACIRESFIEQYTPDVLTHFKDEIEKQLETYAPDLAEKMPAVPPQGTLDLAAVRDARYFFA